MTDDEKTPVPQGDIAEFLLTQAGLRLWQGQAGSPFRGEMERAEIDSNSQPLSPGQRDQLCMALFEAWCDEKQGRLGWKPSLLLFDGQEVGIAGGENDGSLLDMLVERAQRLLEMCREHGEQYQGLQIWRAKARESAARSSFPDSPEKLTGIISELEESLALLARLKSGCPLDTIRGVMEGLFGAALVGDIVKDFVQRYGKSVEDGKSRHYRHGGRLCIPAVGGGTASGSEPTLPHTHYGSEVRHDAS